MVDKELDCRFEYGYTKPTCRLDLSDKKELVRAIWLHHVFFNCLAELQQLKKGLCDTLEMDSLINSHPCEIYGFLVSSHHFDVDSDYILDTFSVHYSERGSNKRISEEAIFLNWSEYVTECDSKFTYLCIYG